VLLITGIPAGFLTSSLQDRIARETGYRATIAGSTKIGLWPSLNVAISEIKLEPPNDNDSGHRIAIGSVEAFMTLGSLWSGQPKITELVIKRPMISLPLLRERRPAAKVTAPTPAASPGNRDSSAPKIDRITLTDGEVTLFNARDHFEGHIKSIGLHAVVGGDHRISIAGSARAGGHGVAFDIKAQVADLPLERQTIPLDVSIDAPELLGARLSSKASLRLNGSLASISGLSGAIGNGGFDGWGSIDLASKPQVKLDLDFKRLDIGAPASDSPQASPASWSKDRIDLTALNYVDAELRLSAAELNIGSAHFSPAAIQAGIENGFVKCAISNLGAYDGLANGEIDIDASHGTPAYTIHGNLTGMRALPLLRSAADFDKLDGKLRASIAVRSEGQSQQDIMSNLTGTATANFRDGAIRGLNVAQMIRALTSAPLSGWQEDREQSTDLTQLSASFRIDKGQAVTSDLNLVGPLVKMTGAGTIDIASRTLALRVEPKLVMTTQGQGRSSDPVGFGIPVMIEGPWADPRIYPDIAGILDNPDAAYAKLKELGRGLFAPGEPGSGSANGGNSLGETLDNLIQQGLNAGRRRTPPPNSSPNDSSRQQDSQPLNDIMKQLFGR
jgi:AsmA protein